MPEWLYEEGIGENRAILVAKDRILEARLEWPGEKRVGSVEEGRLTSILVPGRRGIATLAAGDDVLIEPLPVGVTEGRAVRVEIVREAILEGTRAKLPKGRLTQKEVREGPSLIERLHLEDVAVTMVDPNGPDRFERAGWSELLEEAATGEVVFPGGTLKFSLTPAMTLFDVDGALPPSDLGIAGAVAAAGAIRRLGIGGSIGIDLPTLSSKADRLKAAEAFDAVLPQPFERTAVNGFGFLQVIRRREHQSIPERVQAFPAASAARALLRLAERTPGAGERALHAAPAVAALIERNPDWMRTLSRRIGAPGVLRPEPGLAISAGYVHSRFNT